MQQPFSGEKLTQVKENLLSLEAKKQLADFWYKITIKGNKPEDLENLNDTKFLKNIYQDLIKDPYSLFKEWDTKPDDSFGKLVEELKLEENPDKKAILEYSYLEKVRGLISTISDKLHNLPESSERTLAWNSYPEAMRANKDFDCTGATLLGISLLDKTPIDSYMGNPNGHSVNIIKLSNGEWVWLDLNKSKLEKINPEIKEEANGDKFFIFPKLINQWSQCHVAKPLDILTSIIGNFDALKAEYDGVDTGSGSNKELILKVYSKIQMDLQKVNFTEILQKISPDREIVNKLMEERMVLQKKDLILKPLTDLSISMSPSVFRDSMTELKEKKESLIISIDKLEIETNISNTELRLAFDKFIENLVKLKKEEPDYFPGVKKVIINMFSDL